MTFGELPDWQIEVVKALGGYHYLLSAETMAAVGATHGEGECLYSAEHDAHVCDLDDESYANIRALYEDKEARQ